MSYLTTLQASAERDAVERLVSERVADENERRVRTRVVRQALAAVMRGAHYLRGCVGGLPLSVDMRERLVEYVNLGDWEGVALHAARFPFSNYAFRCAGRCENPNTGGRIVPPSETRRVRSHLEEEARRHPNPWTWAPLGGFYPRRILPLGSSYPDCVPQRLRNGLFLGEDCATKLHFDCIGLVNWVFWRVSGQARQYGIPMIRSGPGTIEAPDNPANLTPGDLLVKEGDGHIGIVGVNGHVIDAFGETYGVVCRTYARNTGDGVYWRFLCPLRRFIRELDTGPAAH